MPLLWKNQRGNRMTCQTPRSSLIVTGMKWGLGGVQRGPQDYHITHGPSSLWCDLCESSERQMTAPPSPAPASSLRITFSNYMKSLWNSSEILHNKAPFPPANSGKFQAVIYPGLCFQHLFLRIDSVISH